MRPERDDVVHSSDPFKLGDDRLRPWLIVNNESHPFGNEQFVAVAVSTKQYSESIALSPDVWEIGGVPRDSFVSPWAVHSLRGEDPIAWQGRVGDESSISSSTRSTRISDDPIRSPNDTAPHARPGVVTVIYQSGIDIDACPG